MSSKTKPQMDVDVSKYTARFNVKWRVERKDCTDLLVITSPNWNKDK